MSMTPMPLADLPKPGLASGRMEFKEDGTFEAQVSMPGVPQGSRQSGTYRLEGDVVTIVNSQNNSPMKSKWRIEGDHLVMQPLAQERFSLVFYYKRINH